MSFATPYWISTVLSMNMAILKGDARIIVSDFDVENCFKYIQVYKVSQGKSDINLINVLLKI